jgi:hypothetical protein
MVTGSYPVGVQVQGSLCPVGENDEAKRDKSDGEYERDDDDPVPLETEGDREEDDFSFDDEYPPKIKSNKLIIPLKAQYRVGGSALRAASEIAETEKW